MKNAGPGRRADLRGADRLIAESGGNPLALQDLPGALTSEQLAGCAPLPDRLDLGTRLQQVFLQQVRGLPEATRRLLLVAAAEDTGQPTVLAAVPALGIGPEALEAAEQVGLMPVEPGSLVRRFAMLLFILVAPSLSPKHRVPLSTRSDPAAVDPGHVDAIAAANPTTVQTPAWRPPRWNA